MGEADSLATLSHSNLSELVKKGGDISIKMSCNESYKSWTLALLCLCLK
jgi:hypothetical protein